MSWSKYEVFSVISGLVLIACCFAVPDLKVKDRLGMLAGGVIFVGYGFYVAGQTSGEYSFPAVIFIIPFAAVGYGAYKAYEARSRRSQRS